MALALRPGSLDDLGLMAAVRRYALQTLGSAGILVEVTARDIDRDMDPSLQTVLFRIIQEAINNVARHSGGTNAHVRLWRDGGEVLAEVDDDGEGFNMDAIAVNDASSRKLGVLGMQERTSLVGGHFTIESAPGHGTCVRVRIPYKRGEPDRDHDKS